MDRNVISIVIVNWNSGPHLERCVRSLSSLPEGTQVLIVDNASTDSSLEFANAKEDGIIILRNNRNLGFAAAANIGWRTCRGDYILFLNPDIECLPESIGLLENTLRSDPSVWAAGGQLIGPSGSPQTGFNVRAFPTVKSVAAEMFFLDEIWSSNPWSGANYVEYAMEVDVDQPAAACLMICRKALETLDGFDEGFYPAWFEDVDLCRRIRTQGGRIRYQPRACFGHFGGYSLEKLTRLDFLKTFHRNQIRYFFKHHGSRSACRVRKLAIAGLILRSAISLAFPLIPKHSRTESASVFWHASRYLRLRQETSQ